MSRRAETTVRLCPSVTNDARNSARCRRPSGDSIWLRCWAYGRAVPLRAKADDCAHLHSYAGPVADIERPGAAQSARAWLSRPVLTDIALGVVVAIAIALAMTAKVEPEARDPDSFAYLFAIGLGALMLVRRRWPTGVLVVTVVALFAYYLIGYPAVGVAVPVAGAVYSAAEQGRVRAAIVVSALVLVLSTLYRLTEEPAFRLLGFEGAQNLVLLVAVVALGDSVRSRADLRRQSLERAEQAQRDHERSAREQVEQERLRIAREVHDVLAHSLSAISIQSVVALEALPAEPNDAAAAVRSIRQVSTSALADLRSAVGILRDPAAEPLAPVGGLAALDRLVATAAESGVQVAVSTVGTREGIPLVVDAAAYRIVQESITNVLRHSGAVRVTVQIDCRPREVRLRIVNPDGGEPSPLASEHRSDARGFGIAGMRERAELLGGAVHAGPTAGGGFEVTAVLPYPESAPSGGPTAARPSSQSEPGQQLTPLRPLAEQS